MRKILIGVLIGMSFAIATTASLNAAAAGNAEAGKLLVEKLNCASCHGRDFNSPSDPSYPKLAGQPQDYLQHSLVAYRRGNTAMNGRTNAIMSREAKLLSDQEIQNIAAYLHGLPGSLVLRK